MFRDSASIENVAIPAMMFVIFGSFYMQNKNSLGQTGFLFCIHPEFKAFTVYVVFLVAEVLIYFILVGEYAWNWRYYWVILTELLLIPFYIAGKYNDFAMRASIPAIFFMMVMVLQYLLDARLREAGIIRRKALVAAVIIGYMTSVVELQRNIAITLTSPESEYINHSLPSFQNIQLESENAIKLIFDQYLVTDYKDSFFYKHIAER